MLLQAFGALDDLGFDRQVQGASTLHLRDLVSAVDQESADLIGNPQKRFGFHDDITAQVLLDLIDKNNLPPFTVAYFPNNDFVSHAESPAAALATLQAFDGRVEDGIIQFSEYPNAFERIKSAIDLENSGHLFVTAQIGHEFGLSTTSVHTAGGSHGALHAGDSIVPLITAGIPAGITLPKNPRTVDVAPLCLSILGGGVSVASGRPACITRTFDISSTMST